MQYLVCSTYIVSCDLNIWLMLCFVSSKYDLCCVLCVQSLTYVLSCDRILSLTHAEFYVFKVWILLFLVSSKSDLFYKGRITKVGLSCYLVLLLFVGPVDIFPKFWHYCIKSLLTGAAMWHHGSGLNIGSCSGLSTIWGHSLTNAYLLWSRPCVATTSVKLLSKDDNLHSEKCTLECCSKVLQFCLGSKVLTHLPLVRHICVGELGEHLFR